MMINSSANVFVKNRSVLKTQKRFIEILKYLIYCYQKLLQDNHSYSRVQIKEFSSSKFEDYLKESFVDNYLQELKKGYGSIIEKTLFQYETGKKHVSKNKEHLDKIDIIINDFFALQEYWKNEKIESLYFAVECKVLNDTSTQYKSYVNDIEKMCNRNYQQLRLPYEGMIAFVEKYPKDSSDLTLKINNRLKESSFQTKKYLTKEAIRSGFDESYISEHSKSFDKKSMFSIYHLIFDYSTLIIR